MIDFTCECGFKTQVKDDLVGQKIKCPNCGRDGRVVAWASAQGSLQTTPVSSQKSFLKRYGLIILVLVVIVSVVIGKALFWTPKHHLPHLFGILEMTQLDAVSWKLALLTPDEPADEQKLFTLKSNEEAIADIRTFVARNKNEPSPQGYFVTKYQIEILALFEHLDRVGEMPGAFVYMDTRIPVHFALHNRRLAIVISGASSDMVYNTARTSEKERAAKTIERMILPELPSIHQEFSNTDVRYYAMSAIYGSRAFVDEGVYSSEAEIVTVVVSKKMCGGFVDGKITQDRLLQEADVYLGPRAAGFTVKKITVALE